MKVAAFLLLILFATIAMAEQQTKNDEVIYKKKIEEITATTADPSALHFSGNLTITLERKNTEDTSDDTLLFTVKGQSKNYSAIDFAKGLLRLEMELTNGEMIYIKAKCPRNDPATIKSIFSLIFLDGTNPSKQSCKGSKRVINFFSNNISIKNIGWSFGNVIINNNIKWFLETFGGQGFDFVEIPFDTGPISGPGSGNSFETVAPAEPETDLSSTDSNNSEKSESEIDTELGIDCYFGDDNTVDRRPALLSKKQVYPRVHGSFADALESIVEGIDSGLVLSDRWRVNSTGHRENRAIDISLKEGTGPNWSGKGLAAAIAAKLGPNQRVMYEHLNQDGSEIHYKYTFATGSEPYGIEEWLPSTTPGKVFDKSNPSKTKNAINSSHVHVQQDPTKLPIQPTHTQP